MEGAERGWGGKLGWLDVQLAEVVQGGRVADPPSLRGPSVAPGTLCLCQDPLSPLGPSVPPGCCQPDVLGLWLPALFTEHKAHCADGCNGVNI